MPELQTQNYLIRRLKYIHFKTAIDVASQYCNQTLLHGLRFTVDTINYNTETSTINKRKLKQRRLISLSIWASINIFALAFSIYLMQLIWTRFKTNPTSITIETNNYPISNVEFPTISICENNKVYKPAALRLTKELVTKFRFNEKFVLGFMKDLRKLINHEIVTDNYTEILNSLFDMGFNTRDLMLYMMPPCDELIQFCLWLGRTYPCSLLFRIALTADGFCCAFNYKGLSSDNYENATIVDLSKVLPNGSGSNIGLRVGMQIGKESYYSYNSIPYYGVQIYTRPNGIYPRVMVSSPVLQPGYELGISIIPTVIVTDPSLKRIPVSQRNCYFEDEKILKTSDVYSYETCIVECTIDEYIDRCSCIPFFIPKMIYFYSLKLFEKNTYGFNNTDLSGMDCDCYSSCNEHRYRIQSRVACRSCNDKRLKVLKFPTSLNMSLASSLTVSFKDLSCIQYRRDVYMTWDGLFAAFGGTFGLFLGGSILSLFEILYFSTFKFYERVKSRKLKVMEMTKLQKLLINGNRMNVKYIHIKEKENITSNENDIS